MRFCTRAAVLSAAALIAAAGPAAGQVTIVDTFEGGVNLGSWAFSGLEEIRPVGGNPGAYLGASGVLAFAPGAGSFEPGSPWLGNLVQQQVLSMGVDAITLNVEPAGGAETYNFSLILMDADDNIIYRVGPNVPAMGAGWVSYDFDIPTDFVGGAGQLPPGWGGNSQGDFGVPFSGIWQDTLSDVVLVAFAWTDPQFGGIFRSWEVGIDNARVSFVPEPVSAAIPLLGLTAAVLRRRRR